MWFKAQLRVDHHFCYVTIHGGRLELKVFDQQAICSTRLTSIKTEIEISPLATWQAG